MTALALAWRFRLPIAAIVGVLALMWVLNRYVAGEVHDDRNKAAVEALQTDGKADDVAGHVAASQAAAVETKNSEARTAAAKSNDPLADGLRALNKK